MEVPFITLNVFNLLRFPDLWRFDQLMLIEISYRRPLIRTNHHLHHHISRSFHRHHLHHSNHHHHKSANPVLKHPTGCRVRSTITKHSHYGTNDVNYENEFDFNCSSILSIQENVVTSGSARTKHGVSAGLDCGSALCLMRSGTSGESLTAGSSAVCVPKLCATGNQSACIGNRDVSVCLSLSHQMAVEFPLTLSLGSSYSSHCVLFLEKTTSP